jgi:predicted HTH transcriptional regulator
MFRTYIKGECKMFDKYKDGNKLTNKEMFIMAFKSVLEKIDDDNEFYFKKEDNLIKIKAFNKNNKNKISIEITDGVAPTITKNKLTPTNRRKAILEQLDKNPKITQNRLANLLMVSQKTICNDLVILNNNKNK